MKRNIVLRGPRVSLGLLTEHDIPTFTEWMSDLETTLNLGNFGFVAAPEAEREWLDRIQGDENQRIFAIVVNRGSKHIGNCGLHDIDHRSRHASLGIAIGEKSEWSKGYGRESVRLLCDFGFNVLGLHSIHLTLLDFNIRGLKAYEAAGFRETGRLREARRFGSRWVDSIYMDILEGEFRARWRSLVPGATIGRWLGGKAGRDQGGRSRKK